MCSFSDYSKLYNQLFEDYNPDVPPFYNGSEPLLVNFGITALNFDLDTAGFLTSHLWLNIEFKDQRLMWDPKEFGGIKSIRVDSTKIWLPDITLYNRYDKTFIKNV